MKARKKKSPADSNLKLECVISLSPKPAPVYVGLNPVLLERLEQFIYGESLRGRDLSKTEVIREALVTYLEAVEEKTVFGIWKRQGLN